MMRLLLLLLLPLAGYVYWKAFVGAPPAVRAARSKYVAVALAVLSFLLLGVRTGSWGGAGVASLVLLSASLLPSLVRKAGAAGAQGPAVSSPPPVGEMTVSEACQVLGVPADAPRDVILERYRKLILVNHPDQGGSDYLAARIVAAKNTLMNRKGSA